MQLKMLPMRSTLWRKSLFTLTVLLLSGCAHVKIIDQSWCADKGTLGAKCFHTLTDTQETYTKSEWDDRRFGQFCTNDNQDQIGATFANEKAVIEQLCSLSKRCKYEIKKAIQKFFDKAEAANPSSPGVSSEMFLQ